MYDYIKGTIEELSPAEAIIECHGIGYDILISLQTFQKIENQKETKLYIYHFLREDEESFYGFATKDERELFKLLISVSGIGAATARMMLSSLDSDEIRGAILSEDINKIKSVKGIGLKSAQRLILELKDKVAKGEGYDDELPLSKFDTSVVDEATTALVMLGFTKANVTKVLSDLIKKSPTSRVEDLIKAALKKL